MAVTVLVPVKGYWRDYLREAIGSLTAQTCGDWRALVVHERGAGNRVAADLGAAAADPRVELIEERGRKLAGALNTGLEHARTDFAAILLGDDMWAPEAVATLILAIRERPDVDFFHSARRVVDDHGEPISEVMPAFADVTPEAFLERAPVKHLLCFRRELALSIGGFDESLNSVGPDDFDFPWSMSDAGARFGALQECLYVYRDHRAGYRLTTHLPARTHAREIGRILRKHGMPESMVRERVASARRTYLRQCLYNSRLDAWLGRALRRDPGRGWRAGYR